MSILLIALIITAFLILGVAGMLRGVRASLLALVGTFMGVLLVDLWQEPWGEWVRAQLNPENPGVYTWGLTTAIFFVVVLVAGLGSGALIPRPKFELFAGLPKKRDLRDSLAGGGIGLLNGTLVGSYLLHFANRGLPPAEFEALIAAAPPLGILYDWLPWFILALVITSGVFILLRGSVRFSKANTARAVAAQAAAGRAPGRAPANGIGTVKLSSSAATPKPANGGDSQQRTQISAAEQQALLKQLNDKINNRLGK